ncbi:MAG: hypothetical protein NTW29_06400 [Bacteroidetes bacterium]|nr:hypothetical protein [Bacteroidota bacterium]
MKLAHFFLILAILYGQSCSNIGAGFGSYQKPAKSSNKYYNPHFKPSNPKLALCSRYVDLDNMGLQAQNSNEHSYFVFLDNGFVLHNSDCKRDSNHQPQTSLNYSQIHSEDVGNYITKGDTVFWATRPGYLKKKLMPFYAGIITDTGLVVISSPFKNLKFLSLR